MHEHQTISSVVEDVHQVIQNLKSFVVSLDDDIDEAVGSPREEEGPGHRQEDRGPASVTIHDPGHHLLTLADDREVHIELHVNKGRGFVLADQQPLPPGAPVDLVWIDAIYNPVLRANFTVEETRWTAYRLRPVDHPGRDGRVGGTRGAVRYAADLRAATSGTCSLRRGGLEAQVRELAPVPDEAVAPGEADRRRGRNQCALRNASAEVHPHPGRPHHQDRGGLAEDQQLREEVARQLYGILDEHGLHFGMKMSGAAGNCSSSRRGPPPRWGIAALDCQQRTRNENHASPQEGGGLSRSPSHRGRCSGTWPRRSSGTSDHHDDGPAKELRPAAERLITLARRGDLHARRPPRGVSRTGRYRVFVRRYRTRYAARPGGYTRILKLGNRQGDAADMALIELV